MSKRSFNTILFDMDGCLTHSLPVWTSSFRKALAENNIHKTEEELLSIGLHYLHNHDYGITDYERFVAQIYQHLDRDIDQIILHSPADDILKIFHAEGKKLGLVTACNRFMAEKVLKRLYCYDYFGFTCARDDVKNQKPHPEPVLGAMKALSARPEETIMVGDTSDDIGAANAAGATSIWFYPIENERFYKPDEFTHFKPDYVIRDLKELLEIIK